MHCRARFSNKKSVLEADRQYQRSNVDWTTWSKIEKYSKHGSNQEEVNDGIPSLRCQSGKFWFFQELTKVGFLIYQMCFQELTKIVHFKENDTATKWWIRTLRLAVQKCKFQEMIKLICGLFMILTTYDAHVNFIGVRILRILSLFLHFSHFLKLFHFLEKIFWVLWTLFSILHIFFLDSSNTYDN